MRVSALSRTAWSPAVSAFKRTAFKYPVSVNSNCAVIFADASRDGDFIGWSPPDHSDGFVLDLPRLKVWRRVHRYRSAATRSSFRSASRVSEIFPHGYRSTMCSAIRGLFPAPEASAKIRIHSSSQPPTTASARQCLTSRERPSSHSSNASLGYPTARP